MYPFLSSLKLGNERADIFYERKTKSRFDFFFKNIKMVNVFLKKSSFSQLLVGLS